MGEINLVEEKYDEAEEHFRYASKGREGFTATLLGILYLGYIREVCGDFRSALTWYQSLLGSDADPFASSAIEILNARSE